MSRVQIQKVAWITIAWTIISIFLFFNGYNALIEYGFADEIDPIIPFKASIITGLMAGILGGIATVFIWEKWLRSRPYGWTLRNTLLQYTFLFGIVAFVTTNFFQSQLLELPPYNTEVLGGKACHVRGVSKQLLSCFYRILI